MENEFAIPEPANARASNILIVEDNDVNRAYLHDLVLALGHDPHLAENGYEALESIASSIPDLVLLDIMMPGIDGYEVLGQLKSERKLRHLPVIMISAIDDLDSVVRCIECGAEDYLVKPFNTTLLRTCVGACLEKKHLLDAEVHYRRQIEHEKRCADDLLHAIFPPGSQKS